MTSGRRKTKIVAGLHIVRKTLKLGGNRYYVYAWRGGPCIHSQDDTYPVITPDILAKQSTAKRERYGESPDGFEQIITAYRNSPEFNKLAPSTQVEYSRWLNRISKQFGNVPIAVFEDRRMRGEIIEWRNLWASQPRTADSGAVMMSTLLGWGVEYGYLRVNVAAKIKQLHSVDRSDLIWEDAHWKAWDKPDTPAHLLQALKVASWTGLRLGDLVKLQWDHIGPSAIIMTTSKRKGRAVIPILAPMREFIDQTPMEHRTGMVLKNSRGLPWTASGLSSVFQKNKPKGFERHIHDLRGTFCTMLILRGLTDDQVAMVMGWIAKRVAAVRARYVNEERVIISLAERLSA